MVGTGRPDRHSAKKATTLQKSVNFATIQPKKVLILTMKLWKLAFFAQN
jgi:hypothetical protein